MSFQIKRIYDAPGLADGKRVLVDRLWPRGVSKERAHLDLWLKDVAPSPALREWFGHEPEKMEEFAQRYTAELVSAPEKQVAVAQLRMLGREGMVTLLYAAKDPQVNHAQVLIAFLTTNGHRQSDRRTVPVYA